MRTTLTIEDQIATSLQELARRNGQPFRQVVNEALRRGLHEIACPAPRPYRLKPAALGALRAGIDLDKALALADALENDAIGIRLDLRK